MLKHLIDMPSVTWNKLRKVGVCLDFLHIVILMVSSIILIAFINSFVYLCLSYDSGEVFGVSIPKSRSNVVMVIVLGALQLIFGAHGFGAGLSLLFHDFRLFAIYFILFVVSLVLTLVFSYKSGIKRCGKGKNAMALGHLPMISDIDKKIEVADTFCVAYNCVNIISNGKNETISYVNYGYETLQTERELALLAMYFLQRHHSGFRVKVNTEHKYSTNSARGYVYGRNGMQYVNVGSVNTSTVLESYIFTKKS